MINRYRDKHILEMCVDMVCVCVHMYVCWLSGFVVCLSAMRKRGENCVNFKQIKKNIFTVTRLREW